MWSRVGTRAPTTIDTVSGLCWRRAGASQIPGEPIDDPARRRAPDRRLASPPDERPAAAGFAKAGLRARASVEQRITRRRRHMLPTLGVPLSTKQNPWTPRNEQVVGRLGQADSVPISHTPPAPAEGHIVS